MGTIITKNSATSGSVPASLIQGELAINVTNGRLFYGSGSGNIVKEFTGSASGGGTINTGSLLTTASFSNPNLTFTKGDGSTFNVNLVSLVPTSASFASTASFAPNYVLNSATSSFVTNAQTSSFVTNAQTSSFVTNAQTSSMTVLSASFALTASLAPNYILNSATSSFVQNSQTSSFVLNSQTSSMSVASASFASTASFAPNYVLNSATSSFVTNAQTSSMSVASASFALTASYYNETDPVFVAKSASLATTGSNTFNGSQTINGDLIVNGTASIAFLNVTYESASVIYSSGSNQFGDASNDTQTLWGTVDIKSGPVLVTGSLNVSGGITGSLLGTASYANQALSSSYALTASFITASGVYGPYGSNSVISASYALNALSASYAQTASYVQNAVSASYALNGGVTQLLAGPNVTLSPTNGLGQVTVSATLSGSTNFNTATGSYGSFYSTQTQTNVAGTARSMSLNTTDITNGVSVSGSINPFNTYIKTENAGVYNIQFSAQIDKSDAGKDEIWIWLRKNGTDLTDTATSIQLTGNADHQVAAWNFFANAAANDYFQLMWYSPDANVRLHAEPAFGVVPGIPSLIVTANRIDQFLSNTGSFSGSFTGVFTGSLQGTSSWANNAITASYALQAVSASFASTASFAPNYVLNSATSSFVTNDQTSSFVQNSQTSSMTVLSASFASTTSFAPNYVLNSATSSFVTNSQTSSFVLNSQTSSMSVASASFASTASYVLNAVSASFATSTAAVTGTTNYISKFTSDTTIGNSQIFESGSNIGIGTTTPTEKLEVNGNALIKTSFVGTVDAFGDNYASFSHKARAGTNDYSILSDNVGTTYLNASSSQNIKFRIDNIDKAILDSSGNFGIGTTTPTLGNLQVNGNVYATSFTGSLLGTASYATQALSSSYASTASFAPNYVLNSATSSFVTNAQTSSFVTNSQTSSFVLNSQTSSMTVLSASFASTASFAPNYVLNSATSSFVTNAQTSSFVTNAQTSSFVTNSQTSSFVLNSQTSSMTVLSASFASTASYIDAGFY